VCAGVVGGVQVEVSIRTEGKDRLPSWGYFHSVHSLYNVYYSHEGAAECKKAETMGGMKQSGER